jgi:4-amino-4-deoxy-L-arabinose transferase
MAPEWWNFMKPFLFAIIGISLLIYILPLGARPMCEPDETRYAGIPREMISSGNWIVPRLNGLRYFEKPPLGYWLNSVSIMGFGENSFAARLPSALAACISALMVFLLVQRFMGGYRAGLSACMVFLTCTEVFGVGTFNVPDSIFSMFVTIALVLFFVAYMEERRGKRTAYMALFGVFCGLGFLTKGFIAFVVPIVTIVPFLIWERR